MRFIREQKGQWALGDLNPFEFALLSQLPGLADPGTHKAARKRLFPSPIAQEDEEGEEEFVEDWKEYVSTDQANQFERDLQLFRSDLANVIETQEVVEDKEDEGEEEKDETTEVMAMRFRLELSDERAWPWYSALNQARIVLDEKFGLNESEEEDLEELDEEDLTEDDLARIEARWRANLNSQFYGVIQEWLIRGVLQEEVAELDDTKDDSEESDDSEWNDLLGLDFGDEEE